MHSFMHFIVDMLTFCTCLILQILVVGLPRLHCFLVGLTECVLFAGFQLLLSCVPFVALRCCWLFSALFFLVSCAAFLLRKTLFASQWIAWLVHFFGAVVCFLASTLPNDVNFPPLPPCFHSSPPRDPIWSPWTTLMSVCIFWPLTSIPKYALLDHLAPSFFSFSFPPCPHTPLHPLEPICTHLHPSVKLLPDMNGGGDHRVTHSTRNGLRLRVGRR